MKQHHQTYAVALGKKIKAHRQRLKLSQNALGDICGCDAVTIRRIEHGKTYFGHFVLVDMAIVFDIPLEELVRV